ncbi:hypothetical protein [Antribacter gilvus]|uniref:hypothetical protein n=1 Tax=Antribacter gilvus TaxID=2304675 RepID=UPI000F773BF4|nr:hypothetical protein [Antribacter gilvus]
MGHGSTSHQVSTPDDSPTAAAAAVRRYLADDDPRSAAALHERCTAAALEDQDRLVQYVVALDDVHDTPILDTPPLLDRVCEQVAARGPDHFLAYLTALRAAGRSALAIQALHAYGRLDEADLSGLAGRLRDAEDRLILLAAASLNRTPEDAARLAVSHQRPQDADDIITPTILHDVSQQRTVPDVARFLRALHALGAAHLIEDTVRLVAARESGRSNLDKALLHVALDANPHLRPHAEDLLRQTLAAAVAQTDRDLPDQQKDLLAAFAHLSPDGAVLEEWFAGRLQGKVNDAEARKQVAWLLRNSSGAGRSEFLAHLATTASPWNLALIYELLLAPDSREEPEEAVDLASSVAATLHEERISEFLERWPRERQPDVRTKRLLQLVLTPFGDQPLPARTVLGVADLLASGRSGPLAEGLRREAIALVEGRDADEVVELLRAIPAGRHRRKAANVVGEQLAAALLADNSDAAAGWFSECLAALAADDLTDASTAAWHRVADLAGEHPVVASTVAEVAVRMRHSGGGETAEQPAGRAHRALAADADKLLVRFLNQSQSVTPTAVVDVTTRLRLRAYPEPNRRQVIQDSVGRWVDRTRKERVIRALEAAGQDLEAGWLKPSVG